jgi:hypothetical protein
MANNDLSLIPLEELLRDRDESRACIFYAAKTLSLGIHTYGSLKQSVKDRLLGEIAITETIDAELARRAAAGT